MRIDGKQAASEMTAGPAKTSQGELELFAILNGMGHQQIVHALIGNNEGQAIQKFEAFLAESPGGAHVHNA